MKKAIVGYPAAPLRGSQFRAFGGSGRKISGFSGKRQYGNTMGNLLVSPSRSISAEVFAFFQELAFPMVPIKKPFLFSVLPPAQGGGCVKGEPLRVPPSRFISAEVFAFFQEPAFPMAPIKKTSVFCSAACARRGLCEGGTFAGFPFAFHQRRGFRLLPRACVPHGTNKKRACWLFFYWCG